jgi:hypothetical protein
MLLITRNTRLFYPKRKKNDTDIDNNSKWRQQMRIMRLNKRMKQKRDSFSYMYIARKIKKDNRALSRYIIEKEKIHSPFVVVVLRY